MPDMVLPFLELHDGNFGTSSWVLCACCTHDSGKPGWFGIWSGEQHWEDRARFKQYHLDCGQALIDIGKARSK